jgi:chromate reductase
MKLFAISGSLRRDSHNTKLLRAAEELVPAIMEFQLWDGLKAIPPYDEEDDVQPAPPAVAAFRAAIAEADAILISTPEYNHSIPGQLKNAIDWVSRPLATNPLRNKPVAVIGASTGAFGAVWSQAELRKVLGATGARVVDADVALGHAHTKFSDHGELLDEAARDQLAEVVVTLLAETPAPQFANPYLLGEEAREARSVAGNVVAA